LSAGKVTKFSSDGTFLASVTHGSNHNTRGIDIDSSGNVFVVFQDPSPHTTGHIIKYTSSLTGGTAFGPSNLEFARFIAIDTSDNVYVTETVSGIVTKIGSDGMVISSFTFGVGINPFGVAVDSFGDVYVAEKTPGKVTKFTNFPAGASTFLTGLTQPISIKFDSSDNFYAAENTHDINKYVPAPPVQNTPPGSPDISLNGGLSSVGGVEMSFTNVITSGTTSVATSESGQPPPAGFRIIGITGPPTYYEITTTATFSGNVVVCIKYNESDVQGSEANLQLRKFNGGFTDITDPPVDEANNIICGTTTTLSSFAVMELICPAGSFATVGATVCTPAPPGSFVVDEGSSSSQFCSIGKFQPDAGQTSCDDAPQGHFVPATGATQPTPCPAGTFNSFIGSSSPFDCLDADPGSFVVDEGSSSSQFCSAGTSQPLAGQTSCIPAPAGTFVPAAGAFDTIICPADSFCLEGSSSPTPCPAGTTSNEGSSSGSQCLPIDSDNDGTPDNEDACPETFGLSERQGCPVGDKNTVFLHTVNLGGKGSTKVQLDGAEVRVFDRNDALFQSTYGTKNPSGTIYNTVFENDFGRISTCTTGGTGMCIAGEETVGDYLVIVKFDDTDGTGKIVYTGLPKSPGDFVDTNGDGIDDLATKDFQFIKVLKKGEFKNFGGGKKTVVTGSILEVVYPDVAMWDTTVNDYIYPYIFTSDSEWTVNICMYLPEGYEIVGVYDEFGNLINTTNCVQTFVTGETKVVAFEVLDVGSPKRFSVDVELDAKAKGKPVKKIKLSTDTQRYDKMEDKQEKKQDREDKKQERQQDTNSFIPFAAFAEQETAWQLDTFSDYLKTFFRMLPF